MAVDIIITRQEYLNEFKNDVGFVSNLGDYTNNLAGSVMENLKVIKEIDVSWSFSASQANGGMGISELSAGVLQFVKAQGKWKNEGFAVGDELLITWIDASGNQNATATITSLTNQYMIMSWGGFPIPGNINGWITNSTVIYGTSFLTAQIYRFGLVDNGETSVDDVSKVSGNAQGYYGSNIGFDTGGGVRDLNWNTLQRLGQYEDWRTGSMRTRFLSNPVILFGKGVSQRFEIEHEFTIVPYYLDGELSNLQNNIIPQDLLGNNSYKYVYSPGFLNVLSNPNTEKRIGYTDDLGSVAWFNENFNGFNNNYQINSITYTEQATANSANGILVGTKTRITIQVQKNNGNFVVGDRVGVYASYLPEQSEYQNTTLSDLKDNFIYDNALGNSAGPPQAGQDFITKLKIFSPSTNLMTLYFDVEYSSLQKAFLSSKVQQQPTYFLIGVQLGDVVLISGNSDRIIILADVELYDESPDIPDLMDFDKFEIYPHDQQIGGGGFFTEMTSWNEDGLVVDFDFWIDLNKNAVLNTLEFKEVAYNPTTGQYFELDSYSFSVASAVVSSGVQQINAALTRGYILKTGDQFNDVTISVGANVGGIQHYTGRYAQKISWQDWLQNLNVDTVFYDNTKPQNNLNLKSSNYSLLNGYEIRLAVFGNLDGINQFNVSGNTDYLFVSPTITVYDYDTDGVTPPPVWSCVIETFNNANLAPLGGSILTGQDTLFRATWTNKNGPVLSLLGLWGINRIEETNEQGYQITEMSSINDPASNQLLIPSSGTKLFVYLNSGTVVFECLVDGSTVSSGINYNLSSRIHDSNVSGVGKMTESGVIKATEVGSIKIIE